MNYLKLVEFLESEVCVPFTNYVKEIKCQTFIKISGQSHFRFLEDLNLWEYVYYISSINIDKMQDKDLYLMMGACIGVQSNFGIGDIKYKFELKTKELDVYYGAMFSKDIVETPKKLSLVLTTIAEDINLIQGVKELNVINNSFSNNDYNDFDLKDPSDKPIIGFNISKLEEVINTLNFPKSEDEDEDEDEDEGINEDK